MPDLFVDLDALARTRDSLEHMHDLMRRPLDLMGQLAASATTNEHLREKLTSFSAEWEYGIGKLGRYTAGVGEALAQMQQAFTDVDEELARVLRQDAS